MLRRLSFIGFSLCVLACSSDVASGAGVAGRNTGGVAADGSAGSAGDGSGGASGGALGASGGALGASGGSAGIGSGNTGGHIASGGSSGSGGANTVSSGGTAGAGGAGGRLSAGGMRSDGGASGTGGDGANTGSGGVSVDCTVVLNQAGVDTGFETCSDGSTRRRAVTQCPTERISATSPCGSGPPNCTSDADCKAMPGGYCADVRKLAGYCGCYYGCQKDSDCGAGMLCECGVVLGQCVPATCKSNADCGPGYGCVRTTKGKAGTECTTILGGVPTSYACQTAADECRGDAECAEKVPGTNACFLDGDHRVCGTRCLAPP